ncbi:unnamed protein product [marine sediment metagenome]|uniref:Uncharacterized protein n=1 Tax=marine sediment metagenome TaxID=412755 RepID=X0WHE3_9ZZZZ
MGKLGHATARGAAQGVLGAADKAATPGHARQGQAEAEGKGKVAAGGDKCGLRRGALGL